TQCCHEFIDRCGFFSRIQPPCPVEHRQIKELGTCQGKKEHLPVERHVRHILTAHGNEEQHTGKQIEAKSQHAPGKQSVHRRKGQRFQPTENPKIHSRSICMISIKTRSPRAPSCGPILVETLMKCSSRCDSQCHLARAPRITTAARPVSAHSKFSSLRTARRPLLKEKVDVEVLYPRWAGFDVHADSLIACA